MDEEVWQQHLRNPWQRYTADIKKRQQSIDVAVENDSTDKCQVQR